jgi:NTE family protein
MESWMEDQLGELDIRDLAIPFGSVASDLETGERVILTEGPLARAVRASCSVPGFVTPVEIDGRLLCDGGVLDNLPVEAARTLGADIVIGVDLFVPGPWGKRGPVGSLAVAIETMVRRAGGGIDAADILIIPDLSGHSYLSFSKSEQFIALGEAAAEKMLPRIREAIAGKLQPNRDTSSTIPR